MNRPAGDPLAFASRPAAAISKPVADDGEPKGDKAGGEENREEAVAEHQARGHPRAARKAAPTSRQWSMAWQGLAVLRRPARAAPVR